MWHNTVVEPQLETYFVVVLLTLKMLIYTQKLRFFGLYSLETNSFSLSNTKRACLTFCIVRQAFRFTPFPWAFLSTRGFDEEGDEDYLLQTLKWLHNIL